MNIEKFVANYFDKKRSNSVKQKQENTHYSSINKCYQPYNHSFQPSVNQMPKSIYKTTTKTQCSRQQIIERLYTDRRTMEGKRTVQKLTQQQQDFKQNCTFKPQTNPHSKRILKTQTQQDPFQRLYTNAIAKKKLSQTLNNSMYQSKQNYTFQPQTNYRTILNSQTCNLKPIHQRIQQIMQEKRQKLKNLEQNATQKQIREKPLINQVSQKILMNKEEFKKNIFQRISGYIQHKKKKQQTNAVQHQKKIMEECTFKPQINNTVQVSTNFNTRQEQYIRKLQQKSLSRLNSNTFHPQINRISQILVRQERQSETFQDKINRLTSDGHRKQKIQYLQKQLYQQCTFAPQINLISKCLAAQHISHKCNHTPKQQIYQFKPKINKLSEQLVKGIKSRKAESLDYHQNKKQQLNCIKMQIQYKQMKQCTFKPRINYSKPKSNNQNTNINQVRGFQNYIKKIQKINQIKDQKNQIKQKLFNRQKNYKSHKSTTPIQFKLSQGYNTKQAIKQQLKIKFQKQCTFKPDIISFR